MRTYTKKTVQESYLDKITCDICKKEIIKNRFDVNEVKLSHDMGKAFPDGGSGKKFEPDICEKCFIEKIIPALVSMGLDIDYKEYYW